MDQPRYEQEGACKVASCRAGNLWVITVSGDVDFTDTDLLSLAVAEALRTHDGAIAFDLSALAFCDSSMLNALLRLYAQRRRVLLIGVRAQTQRLLDVTGTASIFEQFASIQDAVAVST